MKCHICGDYNGTHNAACPKQLDPGKPPETSKSHKINWRGWEDGRMGKEPANQDPTYLLGHRKGMAALEEAENGFNPFDPR